jgi:glutathione S-transferase
VYELYIANKNYSSWSLRPWILMREHKIQFAERLVPLERGTSFTAFRAFSPSGRVPCLHDEGTVVWDSLAIAEYLAERHDGIWPRDGKARAWARSAAAEMHSGFTALRTHCSMNCGVRVRLHTHPPALTRDVERISELWNEGLSRFGGPFLAGNAFTAVDAFFAPVAFRVQSYGLEVKGDAAAYVPRLLGLEGMQQWYTEALAEVWRDAEHEAEITTSGKVIEDLRTGK